MTRMLTVGLILVVLGGCASTQSAWEANEAWGRGIDQRIAELQRRIDLARADPARTENQRVALLEEVTRLRREFDRWAAEASALQRTDADRRAWGAAFGAAATSLGRDMSTWRPAPSQRITPFQCRDFGGILRCF